MSAGDQRYLGAHLTEEGANFAIWAAAAKKVELCFFNEKNGKLEEVRHELIDRNGPIFHGYFSGIKAGQKYGYRIDGEWNPERGWRFNPNKVLIDPYTHLLSGDLKYVPEIYSHVSSDGVGSGDVAVQDKRDNAKFVPLSVVTENVRSDGVRIRTPWSKTVIYEAHVRGLTQFNLDIPESERGTYKALAHPSVIKYLKELGVTALELQPIHHFLTEPAIAARGRQNYWGYNPIAFSAPHRDYAATENPITELRDAVSTLHQNGIEVILDVVYNHTAEGGVGGPTLSLRGMNSKGYYRRVTGDIYDDVTGCGNTLDASRPVVVRMITDSLRWWCEAIGIDGFRFDLASALARRSNEIDGVSALIVALVSDPVLRERKLIAEPWDTKGYALGAFPYPWREWNDQYRDVVRKFWLHGYTLKPGDMATRVSGSHDVFFYRGPNSSINFLTAHDGFTLNDLTSYNEKHNEANSEENRDGTNNNYSWNLGVEGPTSNAAINEFRLRLQKSLLASLIMSAGVPMILMGDEVGRSQSGSNNAYSLPLNESGNSLTGFDSFNGGWALNWNLNERERELLETTKTLISLRKEYLAPVARTFFTGELDLNTSRKDLAWFTLLGKEMGSEDWNQIESKSLSMYVEASENQGLLMLFNGEANDMEFTLPEAKWGSGYRTVFDSAKSVINYEPRLALPSGKVTLAAHSVQIWFVNRD